MKRREFVKSAMRFGVLVSIGFGTVWGVRAKKVSTKAKATCSVNPSCAKCNEYVDCTKDAKQVRETASGGTE